MNKKRSIAILLILITSALLFWYVYGFIKSQASKLVSVPPPTPLPAVVKLTDDQLPIISLEFTSDGHFVDVSITNINASFLEYNIIYDAQIKRNGKIQNVNTGVNDDFKVDDSKRYTLKQLLGSESSGKFTYHEKISNAVFEITLRDSSSRSIYSNSHKFDHQPGKKIVLD